MSHCGGDHTILLIVNIESHTHSNECMYKWDNENKL